MKKFITVLMLLLTISLTACGATKSLYYPGLQTTTGYKSTYLGFTFTTPSGYQLLSRENLIKETKMPLDANSATYAEDAIEYGKENPVYEMAALNNTTGSNVIVACCPYKPTGGDMNNDMEYFRTFLQNYVGAPVTQSDATTKIADREYQSFTVTTKQTYGSIHQELFVSTLDDKMVLIAITWVDGEEASREVMIDAFSAIIAE